MNDNDYSADAAQQKRKNEKGIFFFFIILSFSITQTFAQTHLQDVIQLKDGSTYRGLIKEQNTEAVKIEITGGSIIAIQRINIDSMYSDAPAQFKDFKYRQKQFGYFNVTTTGVMVGSKSYNPYSGSETAGGFSAQTVHGYRFYSHYLAGAGVGIDVIDHPMLQLYADGRYELLKTQYTPYLFADLGYGMDLKANDSSWFQKTTYGGGMIWGIGAGMRFNFKNTGAFVFDAQYKVMKRDEHVYYYGSESYWQEYFLRRIVFRIGLAF